MFGIFSKKNPQCILDENTRLWMEHAFIWLATQFGEEKIKQTAMLLPNTDFFPFAYNGTHQQLLATAAVVAKQMDIDINNVALDIYKHTAHGIDGNFGHILDTRLQSNINYGTAGLYFGKNDSNKYEVYIEQRNFKHPEKLVAVIAHEFAHIKLLGENIISENDEHLTDLVTVILGAGIFNANAAFYTYTTFEGWGYSTLGYFRQQEWAYALALYAFYRGEQNPAWVKYLTPNLKADFKKSEAYINANAGTIFKSEFQLPETAENDAFYAGQWFGEYTYGLSYGEKYNGRSERFTIDILIKDGAVTGTCIEEKLNDVFTTPAVVKGYLENNYISFVKRYPSSWKIDGEQKVYVNTSKPSQRVFYFGYFKNDMFSGAWEIKTLKKDKDGVYNDYTLSGTWTMKRAQ